MKGIGMHKPLQTLEGSIVTSEPSHLVSEYSHFLLVKQKNVGLMGIMKTHWVHLF